MKVKWGCISFISQSSNGRTLHYPHAWEYFLNPAPSPSPDPKRNPPEARAATKDKSNHDENLFIAIPVHAV